MTIATLFMKLPRYVPFSLIHTFIQQILSVCFVKEPCSVLGSQERTFSRKLPFLIRYYEMFLGINILLKHVLSATISVDHLYFFIMNHLFVGSMGIF